MLYLPDNSYLSRFRRLAYPLPSRLLEWLFSRGLAIYVLPKEEKSAIELMVRINGTWILDNPTLEGDGRVAHKTAHYQPPQKCIIIPHTSFYREWGENVLLHELGHAIDFLYTGDSRILSSQPAMVELLRPKKLLNTYCASKYKQSGLLLEQFACSFVAYFQEPDPHLLGAVSTIHNISPELVGFFKKNIVDNFQ